MKTRTTTMKLIAAVAIAVAAPQTSYTQHTRPQDVNVVNTPNVNSQQGGAWSVGINPSSNTVLIASSPRDPVLTTPTLQMSTIFQKQLQITIAEGQYDGNTSFTVPAGVVLDIGGASGVAHMGAEGQFPGGWVLTTGNNTVAAHFLTVFFSGPFGIYSVGVLGGSFYADPGSPVVLFFSREPISGERSGVCTLDLTVSGHYINQ